MAQVLNISVETSSTNPAYYAVHVRCEDGIAIAKVCEALSNYKKQSELETAFKSNGVQIFIRLESGRRFVLYGTLPKRVYDSYKQLQDERIQKSSVQLKINDNE